MAGGGRFILVITKTHHLDAGSLAGTNQHIFGACDGVPGSGMGSSENSGQTQNFVILGFHFLNDIAAAVE